MAKTATIYTSVKPELKSSVEQILDRLGVTPSDAVTMFFNQVVLHNGIPFQVKIPSREQVEALNVLMADAKESEQEAEQQGWLTIEQLNQQLGLV